MFETPGTHAQTLFSRRSDVLLRPSQHHLPAAVGPGAAAGTGCAFAVLARLVVDEGCRLALGPAAPVEEGAREPLGGLIRWAMQAPAPDAPRLTDTLWSVPSARVPGPALRAPQLCFCGAPMVRAGRRSRGARWPALVGIIGEASVGDASVWSL